ncbi:MAG: hypothetical protein PHW87_00050 [Methanothrix sp.]|nr:hypothetical protein [Methanothrix sp.]
MLTFAPPPCLALISPQLPISYHGNRTPPHRLHVPRDFSVLIAPVELMAGALNSHLELQRYKILFIIGNYSRILSRLNRNITELDVRRPTPSSSS